MLIQYLLLLDLHSTGNGQNGGLGFIELKNWKERSW